MIPNLRQKSTKFCFLGEAAEDDESESVEAASAAAAVADELSAKDDAKDAE